MGKIYKNWSFSAIRNSSITTKYDCSFYFSPNDIPTKFVIGNYDVKRKKIFNASSYWCKPKIAILPIMELRLNYIPSFLKRFYLWLETKMHRNNLTNLKEKICQELLIAKHYKLATKNSGVNGSSMPYKLRLITLIENAKIL